MKHILFILFLSLLGSYSLNAQITYTNNSFFQEGDILFTSTDNAPSINQGAAAGNQTWDFSNLSSGQEDMIIVQPAASGAAGGAFPNADVYINFAGGEVYLEITPTAINQVGYAGNMAGFDVITPFTPAGKFKVAPLTAGDSYSDTNGVSFTIPADEIPFIDSLGLPVEPDSIRITQLFETESNVDAWGTLKIPNGITYDVIRLKKLQTTSTKIEMYVAGIFPIWVDVTDLITGAIGGGLGGLPTTFGDGTVESYEYLADGIKESIATVTLDSVGGTPRTVTYKVNQTSTAVNSAIEDPTVFSAYPNPAFSNVKVDVRGFDAGNYNINLYNLTGKLVQANAYEITSDSTVVFNVAQLPRGTYLYALIDEEGITLRAKRIMVIKP